MPRPDARQALARIGFEPRDGDAPGVLVRDRARILRSARRWSSSGGALAGAGAEQPASSRRCIDMMASRPATSAVPLAERPTPARLLVDAEPAFRGALTESLEGLELCDRNMLRFHHFHGLTVEQLADMFCSPRGGGPQARQDPRARAARHAARPGSPAPARQARARSVVRCGAPPVRSRDHAHPAYLNACLCPGDLGPGGSAPRSPPGRARTPPPRQAAGRCSVTRVPSSGAETRWQSPPIASRVRLTIARPRPWPGTPRVALAR